nr:hypothetical protein [Tanacetum cinerariifolium]
DPKEDPADYPADGGDNDDDESSDDDDDDDDVEKEEEEEEHLALADPSAAIAIYETKTNMALKSMSQTERQEEKISTLVVRQKHYRGSKPLCSKCNYHHDGPCAPKCHKCNRVGHLARDCRSSTNTNTTSIQKGTGASQKATCYECGNQRHYRRDCAERNNQNHENQIERDNDVDESSDDDDNDDDVEKDEKEEEHLALADPSAVSTNDLVPSS